MNLDDLKRFLRPLSNKVSLMIGRAILKAIENGGQTQKLQVLALSGETISRMERFQEYGLETYPPEESEVAAVFLNGNRDRGIALCVHNRGARLTDLVKGEVAMYTSEDALAGGHRIHFKNGQAVDILGDIVKIETASEVQVIAPQVTVTATDVDITANNVDVTAAVQAIVNSPDIQLGNGGAPALEKLMTKVAMDKYNLHQHTYVTGGFPFSTTVPQAPNLLVEDTDTTKDTMAS